MQGLVVENDVKYREQLVHALDDVDFQVVRVAGSSDAALDMLSTNRFDLTLLDIAIPGPMSGRDLARRITSRMGTILIGERPFEEEFTPGNRIPAFYYLTKPINGMLLHSCLKVFLEQQSLRKEVARLRRELRTLRSPSPPDEEPHQIDDLWFCILDRIRRRSAG